MTAHADDERATLEAVADEIAGAHVEDTGGGVLALIVDAAYGLSVYATPDPESPGWWIVAAHDGEGQTGTRDVLPRSHAAVDVARTVAHAVADLSS
jgi:hypothetical protein